MCRFRTTHGEWLVRIDIAAIRRIRDCLAIDLFDLLDREQLSTIGEDWVTLAEVVWVLVEPCAACRGIDRDTFIASIAGDALEAMAEAFGEALIEFLPEVDPNGPQRPADADPAAKREPIESMVCRLAAKVPIEPGPFTFRQLAAMARTSTSDRWDHTASVLFVLACAHRNPKSPPPTYEKFHPFAKDLKRRGMSVSQLHGMRGLFKTEVVIPAPQQN